MIRQGRRFMLWVGVAGLLATLMLEGCATKSSVGATSGAEPTSAPVQGQSRGKSEDVTAQSGSGQVGRQNQQVTGFSKTPREEQVQSMTVVKASQEELNAPKGRENAKSELGDIYFAFDKWILSGEDKTHLLQDAELMKQKPTAPILIEGYCDERGSREYNLVLGDKRAKETEQYLLALGIKNPIKIISYGKERQVCAEHDESCYWKNRRAHLLIGEGK